MRLAILLAVSSLLVSCVNRPKGLICLVDAPEDRSRSRRICFDLEKDFDNEGNVLKSATPKIQDAWTTFDLNKHTCFDPDTWASVKTYLRQKSKSCK
jgi:hypothetical protein